MASQSALVGMPIPRHVIVSVPPGATIAGLAFSVTAGTVIVPLTARCFNELLAKRRSSYVPGASDGGTTRPRLPALVPVVNPHTTYAVSGAPVGTTAIQSVAVAAPMPAQVAVTVPVAGTDAGLALRDSPVTVTTLETASRCRLFCANRRSSYVPDANVAGNVVTRLPLVVPVVN